MVVTFGDGIKSSDQVSAMQTILQAVEAEGAMAPNELNKAYSAAIATGDMGPMNDIMRFKTILGQCIFRLKQIPVKFNLIMATTVGTADGMEAKALVVIIPLNGDFYEIENSP